MVSMTSSRVAHCSAADCAWNAMQVSHLVATEIARQINSLVLITSAFGSNAARARAENSFITFGVPVRSSLTAANISVEIPSQFLIHGVSHFLFLSNRRLLPGPRAARHRRRLTLEYAFFATKNETAKTTLFCGGAV